MNRSLLIADDEALIRQGIIARLEYLNLKPNKVYEAENGRQALEIMKKHKVDIVITDIRMADMDGITFIKEARPNFPKVQFIILSGYAEFSYAEQAIRLNVGTYLLKPIANDALKEAIEGAIARLEEGESLSKKVIEATQSITEMKNNIFEKNVNDLLRDEDAYKRKEVYDEVDEKFPLKNRWLMLGIINVDGNSYEQKQFKHNDIDLILFVIKNVFNELQIKSDKIIVNNRADRNQLYTILSHENKNMLRKEAEQIYTRLQNVLWRSMGISLTIGISGENDMLSFKNTKEAQKALLERMVHGNSNLYFFNDIKFLSTYKFPTAEFNMLHQYIERRDVVNIDFMLNTLFSEEMVKKYNITYIRIAWVRIINMLLKTVNLSPKNVEKLVLNLEYLDSFHSLNDLKSYLNSLILDCLQIDGDIDINSKNKVKLAIKYIEDNFNIDISINDLADKFAISPNYFSTIFKKETGQTTMNYIKTLRLNKACEYLKYSDKSVADIAKEVGYQDSQYFFKVFKKAIGQTPLAYRRLHSK
ncbi:MAG: response regulator [Clostridiales bacterium]|nr:response regulator [Clostridiales bacterium]